jgi:hypothetical protein
MSSDRHSNGRFGPGNRANPNGRPRKATDVDDEILGAFSGKVNVNDGNGKRRMSKLRATAEQLANAGATGKLARQALDVAQKAAERKRAVAPPVTLTPSDQAIVESFFAEYRRSLEEGDGA